MHTSQLYPLLHEGVIEQLISRSERLTRHYFHSGAMPSTESLVAEVTRMFDAFDANELPLLRAYVDAGQRFGFIEKFVRRSQPGPISSLQDHIATALQSLQFCVTLNGLTKWSENYADLLQRDLVQPLMRKLGRFYSGCDTYAFIGNYGWTPFGVHDDGDHSLLLHLGPGEKAVYVWPRQAYIEQTGAALTKTDFMDILPSGERYVLRPGDMLFIPKGDFHVLHTPEFSVMLGFTIFPLSTTDDLTQALPIFVPSEREDLFVANGDYFSRSTLDGDAVTLSELLKARRIALMTNGFVTTLPRRRLQLRPDAEYCGSPWHPIAEWRRSRAESRSGGILFVRGHAVRFSVSEGLREVSECVNSRRSFDAARFREVTSEYWSGEAASHVLDTLWALGGIRLA